MQALATADELDSKRSTPTGAAVVTLPAGLLGFEQFKRFDLIGRAEEKPFLWLRVISEPHLAFCVVRPHEVVAGYRPDIPAEEMASLGLRDVTDVLLLNVVTLHDDGHATVN